MWHTVHTVSILFLAVYAVAGTSEVSPDFRLGSGAGATYSDSYPHSDNHDPQPRSSATMPLVAFAFIWASISWTMLLLSWTYLYTRQDAVYDGRTHRLGKHKRVDMNKTKDRKERQPRGIRHHRRYLKWLMYFATTTSFVESEALSAETTPLRTTNPIKPLLHYITTTTNYNHYPPSPPSLYVTSIAD